MSEKRPARKRVWITGSLILLLLTGVGGLCFYRDLSVAYHLVRLEIDPGHLLRLVPALPGSVGERALSKFVRTGSGRERLRATLAGQMLERLTTPGADTTTAALDPTAWDEIELEIRRLHYDGPAAEWWVVYRTRDSAGRTTTGSTRAGVVLVALERCVSRVESGEGGAVSLPAYPGIEFTIRPSAVEKGEWRVLGRRASGSVEE